MKVKIFQAFGKDEIDDLEGEINEWLNGQSSEVEIKNTHAAVAGGIGQHGAGEYFQTLVVCVWYDEL